MRFRSWLPGVLCLGAGCASPPAPDPYYADTAARVELSIASMETDEPVALPVEAELQGPHPVEEYARIALERNPEVLAAQRDVAARGEVIPQVTALDDPMLTDTFMPISSNSLQTAAGRAPNVLSLSQKYPWLSKLRVRGEIAEQETKMALTRLAQAQLKTIEEVYLAYYDIYFYQRAIEITKDNRGLLERLYQIAKTQYQVDRENFSFQDVLLAQVELDKIDSELIALGQQLRDSQADLARLLHASPESLPAAATQLPTPSAPDEIDRLYEAAVRCRPELQEQFLAIVRDQRSEELARLQYYPDFVAGIGWQAVTTSGSVARNANGRDNVGFTLGVNLPIWRDKLRAGVREAEHRVVESARRYDSTRDDTFRLIRRLTVDAKALEEQIQLFRDQIITDAETTLRTSQADYTVGKVSFLQLIDNWSQLLQFQIQLVRFEATLGQRLASLERVVGCQLAALPEPGGDVSGTAVRVPTPTDEQGVENGEGEPTNDASSPLEMQPDSRIRPPEPLEQRGGRR